MSLLIINRVQLVELAIAIYAAEAQCAVCTAQFGIVVALSRGFTAFAIPCPKLITVIVLVASMHLEFEAAPCTPHFPLHIGEMLDVTVPPRFALH